MNYLSVCDTAEKVIKVQGMKDRKRIIVIFMGSGLKFYRCNSDLVLPGKS